MIYILLKLIETNYEFKADLLGDYSNLLCLISISLNFLLCCFVLVPFGKLDTKSQFQRQQKAYHTHPKGSFLGGGIKDGILRMASVIIPNWEDPPSATVRIVRTIPPLNWSFQPMVCHGIWKGNPTIPGLGGVVDHHLVINHLLHWDDPPSELGNTLPYNCQQQMQQIPGKSAAYVSQKIVCFPASG